MRTATSELERVAASVPCVAWPAARPSGSEWTLSATASSTSWLAKSSAPTRISITLTYRMCDATDW